MVSHIIYILYDYISNISISDRGALIYPTEEFIARIFTIYKFAKKILPSVSNHGYLLTDITNYLRPHLMECSTFSCDRHKIFNETGNKKLVDLVLRKFVSPLLKNHCSIVNDSIRKRAVVTAKKSCNRKYNTMAK